MTASSRSTPASRTVPEPSRTWSTLAGSSEETLTPQVLLTSCSSQSQEDRPPRMTGGGGLRGSRTLVSAYASTDRLADARPARIVTRCRRGGTFTVTGAGPGRRSRPSSAASSATGQATWTCSPTSSSSVTWSRSTSTSSRTGANEPSGKVASTRSPSPWYRGSWPLTACAR